MTTSKGLKFEIDENKKNTEIIFVNHIDIESILLTIYYSKTQNERD